MKWRYANLNLSNILSVAIAVLFGIGFHFLITLDLMGNSIRVGTTDLLLPIFLLFIFFKIYKSEWLPDIKVKYGWLWLAAMSIWILVSFFVGVQYTGLVQKWALVNKVIGWFILIGYFICGLWLGRKKNEFKRLFLHVFIGAGFFVTLYALSVYWGSLFLNIIPAGFNNTYRAEGFAGNPNAFGIMMACIYVLFITNYFNNSSKKILNYFISAAILFSIYYSLSRSAWLGLILALPIIVLLKPGLLRPISLSIFLFILLNVLIIEIPWHTSLHSSNNRMPLHIERIINPVRNAYSIEIKKNKVQEYVLEERTGSLNAGTVKIRIDMFKRALSYWAQHPLLGIGIGSFKRESQINKISPANSTIHNSAIWILTEMGLIGLFLFASLYFLIFKELIKESKYNDSLSIGMAGVLLVMLGASVGTEIIYQRYLWFLLGLALSKKYISNKSFLSA